MANVIPEFWMVWNPQGRNPTHRHQNYNLAKNEAHRLAQANPGYDFIILHSVGGFSMPAPGPQEIVIDDGLPF